MCSHGSAVPKPGELHTSRHSVVVSCRRTLSCSALLLQQSQPQRLANPRPEDPYPYCRRLLARPGERVISGVRTSQSVRKSSCAQPPSSTHHLEPSERHIVPSYRGAVPGTRRSLPLCKCGPGACHQHLNARALSPPHPHTPTAIHLTTQGGA